MKNKQKYHTVGTIRKSNVKIVQRGKTPVTHRYMTVHFPGLYRENTRYTQIHDLSFPWLVSCSSIKSGRVKAVL